MSDNFDDKTWGMDLSDMDLTLETADLEDAPVKKNFNKFNRKLTDADIAKYEPMVEKYIRENVAKNWNEAKQDLGKGKGDVSLGNTGLSLNDIRQHLRTEVCIALYNYDPNYRTPKGQSVKESTFVFGHLWKRTGQLMKRLTKPRQGYGVWHANLEETLWETDRD